MRESQFDAADFIETLQMSFIEREVYTPQIVFDLGALPATNNRYAWQRSLQQPAQRYLRRTAVYLFRHLADLLGNFQVPVCQIRHCAFHAKPRAFSRAWLIVFATEHPLPQGTPRGYSQSHRLSHRQQV